jgi:hypothetical protein
MASLRKIQHRKEIGFTHKPRERSEPTITVLPSVHRAVTATGCAFYCCHAPVIGMTSIPGLLFADDLAFSSFTINSLQKTIDQVLKYCREWKRKCNLNKTKILVCKKGGKLKKDEKWFVNDYKIEVVNEINYL